MTAPVPSSIEELTPEWLTAALSDAFPGAEITGCEVADVLYGSAAKVRMNITGSGANLPSSLVVKGSFTQGLGDDEVARQWHALMVRVNEAERRFYGQAAELLDDRVPRCWFAAGDERNSVLILEDLNARKGGVRYGDFRRPLSADEMASILDVLATLHAARWDDKQLAAQPLPDGFLEGGMLDAWLSEANWNQQMARPRAERVPEELSDYRLVSTAIRRAWDLKRSGPQCLVHGDPHIGNMFFDAHGGGYLDWQLFSSGHWAADVVYALAGAMSIEDRRKHERDLLRHYLDRIDALTKAAPSFDDAWRAYRMFAFWGVSVLLTPGEGIQSEEYNAVVGERHARAAVDLESLSLLGVR